MLSLTNRLLTLLLPRRDAALVKEAAGEVAKRCRTGLWRRVYGRTDDMSIAEIRGYARAQAAGCVRAEVERVVHCRRLAPTLQNRVADAAIDQLVTLVARDVLSGEPPVNLRTMAA